MPTVENDGNAVTVGATTALVVTAAVPNNVVGFVKAWMIGLDDLGNGVCFEVGAAGKTNGVGTITPIGAVGTIFTRADAGLAAATVSLTVSANQVEMRATGVAGRTVKWKGEIALFVSG